MSTTYQLSASLPRVTPMTNEQYRTHRNLGRAEKLLIHAIVWEESPEKIARLQRTVDRWTKAWRRCSEIGTQR